MKRALYISILCLITSCSTSKFIVEGGGMDPTINTGDLVYVEKNTKSLTYGDIIYYKFFGIRLKGSDLIQYNHNDDFYESLNENYISRIVAIPGDTISIDNNICVINGRKNDYRLIEKIDSNRSLYEERLPNDVKIRIYRDSVNPPFSTTHTEKVIIPEDCYYILSDNRSEAVDSRHINYISKDEVIGKIVKIVQNKE